MIVVTGASGKLGGLVVQSLLARMPASEIGVAVRDASKVMHLKAKGVRVRQGDYDSFENMKDAFKSSSRVLVISSDSFGTVAQTQHSRVITAAQSSNVKRIVYTSHMGANPASPFRSMIDHAFTEALLIKSKVAFTSLRNGFYASSAMELMGAASIATYRKILAPKDGPVSWTSHMDLAEAAVIALTTEGILDGITPPLTGSEALDFSDLASIASELLSTPVDRLVESDAEFIERFKNYGVPQERAEFLLGIFKAAEKGNFKTIDPTLEKLINRKPKSVRDVMLELFESSKLQS